MPPVHAESAVHSVTASKSADKIFRLMPFLLWKKEKPFRLNGPRISPKIVNGPPLGRAGPGAPYRQQRAESATGAGRYRPAFARRASAVRQGSAHARAMPVCRK